MVAARASRMSAADSTAEAVRWLPTQLPRRRVCRRVRGDRDGVPQALRTHPALWSALTPDWAW